jgi:chitinase
MKTNVLGSKKLSRNLLFFSVLLTALLISVWARAQQVMLAWDANTEGDLAGYKVHYGTSSRTYTTSLDVRNVTTCTVSGLSAGQTYYFAASAYTASGAQSGYSNEVSYSVPAADTTPLTPPAPPAADADSDNDGVPDADDAFPHDPSEWADADGNGIGDNADAAAAGLGPDTPVLVSPVNDEAVSATAVLQTGPFHSAAAGAVHAETRWQVFRDEDGNCLLDIRSVAALTSLKVPKLVLDEGTACFWRAQFIDSAGRASDWSDYEYFTTVTTDNDLNANGIPDVQEVGSTADLDKDGLKDNEQRTIKSVKMEGTTVQIGVSIKDSPTALSVESVESEDPRQPDAYASSKPKRMPFGLINFKIAVAHPGEAATVKLHFSEPAPVRSKWFKFDPIADRWYDFSAYARFAADRRALTLALRDGGAGDADGVANGVIVDPAGVVEEADAEVSTGDSAAAGGGGGGGCFIAAAHARASHGSDGGIGIGWMGAGLMGMTWLVLRTGRKESGV